MIAITFSLHQVGRNAQLCTCPSTLSAPKISRKRCRSVKPLPVLNNNEALIPGRSHIVAVHYLLHVSAYSQASGYSTVALAHRPSVLGRLTDADK